MPAIDALRDYALPEHVLPLAPRRPFARFSPDALAAAAALSAHFPEKRGILSQALRSRDPAVHPDEAAPTVTLEAHFDAVAIPSELGDTLVRLGFEPDGFARFVPTHFAEHHTLKFKVPRADRARLAAVRAEMERRCDAIVAELEAHWSGIEAYLELESYSSAMRRRWPAAAPARGWEAALPFAAGAFARVTPPCTADEAAQSGIAPTRVKRADIHVKIAQTADPAAGEALIAALEEIGLYRVLTWAENHICTAQFAHGADARRCFDAFAGFFDRFGGSSELTLEPVVRVWRSRTSNGDQVRFGALPPLVMSIA